MNADHHKYYENHDFERLFEGAIYYNLIDVKYCTEHYYPRTQEKALEYVNYFNKKQFCGFDFNEWLCENNDVELYREEWDKDREYIKNYETYLTLENFGKMLKWKKDEDEKSRLEFEKHYKDVRKMCGVEVENDPTTDIIKLSNVETPLIKTDTENHKQYSIDTLKIIEVYKFCIQTLYRRCMKVNILTFVRSVILTVSIKMTM